MNPSEISIIIPVLNESKCIGQLLTHLLNCDPNLDIVVVDAKSTDDTVKIVQEFPVQLITSDKMSRAYQMNLGVKSAKNDILYFVHADTSPPPTFHTQVKQAVAQGKPLGCFRFKFISKNFLLFVNSWFTRFDVMWCRGGDQSLFVTRELFEKLNGYDESFSIMEEYDLIKRGRAIASFTILKDYMRVSARKYTTNSWLRIQLANSKAVRQFKKGKSPDEIKSEYLQSLNPY
jgi:rSAM/selenodomain-associated transferase 2